MKEVTYEEWQKNPTPRKMRVWSNDEKFYDIRKVVYILRENHVLNGVITICDDESDFVLYGHCAEIEKRRRMTNKELSRWLREKSTKELGYPVLLRPSYVLGGQNMIIAFSDEDVHEYMKIILSQQQRDNPIIRREDTDILSG